MKRTHLILLVFLLIWGFGFLGMSGQLMHAEETGFFMWGGGYGRQFLLKPGGWSEYLGNFLLQFFRWPWLGSLIVTLTLAGIFAGTRAWMRTLNLSDDRAVWMCLPFILVYGLWCRDVLPYTEALRMCLFFLLLGAYPYAGRTAGRSVICLLLFPLVYLLLPWGGCLMLYLTLALAGFRAGGDKRQRWLMAGGAALLFVWPYLWRRFAWISPSETLYTGSVLPGGKLTYLWWLIYGYALLLQGLALLDRRHRSGKRLFVLHFSLVIVAVAVCCVFCRQKKTEYFYRMDQAVQAGEWEKVLEMAGKPEELTREELYFTTLALAVRGELPERLFDYPVWGSGCLYLPRHLDYRYSMLGGELYYRLKVPNEAIHWTFQASVASPQGMDFRALKRLIDLNIQKRDTLVARKYLSILEKASCYGAWCKDRRNRLADPAAEYVQSQEEYDFFIGGRPFLSDMARLLDAGRSPEMTLDYILCGLLLDKDLDKFCRLFTAFYPYQPGQPVPRAYEEALLVAHTLGWKHVCEKDYPFSDRNRRRYEEYNTLFKTCGKNKEQGKELMKGFRGTWWYYFHFTDPKPTDPRGNMLNVYSS